MGGLFAASAQHGQRQSREVGRAVHQGHKEEGVGCGGRIFVDVLGRRRADDGG